MKNKFYVTFFLSFSLYACAHKSSSQTLSLIGCNGQPELQTARSAELQTLVQQDQKDRAGAFESINWDQVNQRDLQRRIRVASIFAEGCFHAAPDYAAAAMIYQHGTTEDHYYQSFLWARTAVQLGDVSQRWLMAAAIDRYLVKKGYKQLFGTQLSKDAHGNWCIQPVEESVSDSFRIEYAKHNVQGQLAVMIKGLGLQQTPESIKTCQPDLKTTPRGSVFGFW